MFSALPESILRFIVYVVTTIITVYFLPTLFASVWFIILLFLYYRSKDEAFWLAFFLVTTDGFMGFLGIYKVSLSVIPGLPAVELAQFYIFLSVIKAIGINHRVYVFYRKYLLFLLLYILFMLIWGHILGFTGKLQDYFRILKLLIPFLLFYSIPRLFRSIEIYERFFSFVFIVLILALITQLFTLITGLSLAGTIELTEEQSAEAGAFREFFNSAINLLGLFGSLVFLTFRRNYVFKPAYLFLVVFSAFSMAFLSATRGWIISFSFIIAVTLILTQGIHLKRIILFSIISSVLLILGLSNTKVRNQFNFSRQRVETLEAFTEGDLTAEGTLQRLDIRSPRVMKYWKENPVFGWGFSDISREYSDGHVGNQSLLMTSGIVGFSLLIGFLIYFSVKLWYVNRKIPVKSGFKKVPLVFIIFLAGWFILHSTSGQQFNYMGMPIQIIPQAVFFSFGALIYSKSREIQYE